jgi:hypothetical protein
MNMRIPFCGSPQRDEGASTTVGNVRSGTPIRRWPVAMAAVILSAFAAPAQADIYYSTPTFRWFPIPVHANEKGVVAERIVFDANTHVFDYQFYLFNNNVAFNARPIDGFSVFVGAPFALGAATALQVATLLGGGDPPVFPNIGATLDNGVPFLTPGLGFNTLFRARWSIGAWGFQEYDNRGGAKNSYLIRWYLPNQGGQPAINRRQFARFDLYSLFGPVRGGGAVDPFAGGGFILDDGLGNLAEFDFGVNPADTVPTCQSAGAGGEDVSNTDFMNPLILPDITQDPSYQQDFPGLTSASFAPAVPEPETYALLLAGLAAVGFLTRRRRAG